MKKIKDFHGYLNLICLLIIDLLIFLVPKNYDYNIQFWIGFVFIQLPFVGYSLTKFLVNDLLLSESIHYAFLIYIISMILNGLVAFLTPYLEFTFIVLLVFNLVITMVIAGIVVFEIVKNNFKK